MKTFKSIIENYLSKKVKNDIEREKVEKLLLNELKTYLEEVNIPYDISLESLQVREEYRLKMADAFVELVNQTTNHKEYTKNRIVSFSEYLKKNHNVDLELDIIFERDTLNKYERLVDLLKTLQEGKTKKELMEDYRISRKPLEEDINQLVMGTKILGQSVKIRDIQREKKSITYQSTLHPIFLPLNLTEVYYLIIGLKSLAQNNVELASKTYDHLANKIYGQLSEYARNKINLKGREIGLQFPDKKDFEEYNKSVDEQEMATKNIENTLMYLWKAGVKCTIHFNNTEMEVIKDCYIDYDMNDGMIYIKDERRKERMRSLDTNEILGIDFDYK